MNIKLQNEKTRRSLTGLGQLRLLLAFTLAEVMVAVSIVGILSVALFSGISSGFGMVSLAREDLRATQILMDRTEEMRLYNWSQITSYGTANSYIPTTFYETFFPTGSSTNSSSSAAATTNDAFVYYGTIVVTNAGLTESYNSDVRLVTISLVWTNGSRPRTRTVSTIVSQYGMQNYIY